ncbi:MAG TPA: DUF1398 family protein [Steroidobacteraceae bacterium]|nr:DUF1398 family protein [Steroidobacteraceae bacterium]
MSRAIDNLQAAQKRAVAGRPPVGGFPFLAETLRRAGITRNIWLLPACQSLYLSSDGAVIVQGNPLLSGAVDVAPFNEQALIKALRTDQAGEGTFTEFLTAAWRAGVIRYDVDLLGRTVTYEGCLGETYREDYPPLATSAYDRARAVLPPGFSAQLLQLLATLGRVAAFVGAIRFGLHTARRLVAGFSVGIRTSVLRLARSLARPRGVGVSIVGLLRRRGRLTTFGR